MTHKEKINVQFVHQRRGCVITWPPALFIKSQRGNEGLSQSRSLNEIKEFYFLFFSYNAGLSSDNQDIFIAFTAFFNPTKLELFNNSICQQEQLSASLFLLQLCSYLPVSFLAFCFLQTNSRPHLCQYFKAVLFSLSLSLYDVVLSSFSCITEMPVQRHSSELHLTAAAVQKTQLQHRAAEEGDQSSPCN